MQQVIRYIYIITAKNEDNSGHLHVGFCSDMHKTMAFYEQIPDMFTDPTKKLNCLVYLEEATATEQDIIERYKAISIMDRRAKEQLIESINPDWIDLTTV